MPADTANSTCGRRRAVSSARTVASGLPGWCGTNSSTIAAVTIARPSTAQYALRQPSCCPSTVPAGTPTSVATVRPSITPLTARPRRSGGTRETATSEATPKYAPCGRPETKRAAITSQ